MCLRTTYEMTEDDLRQLLDACKQTSVMSTDGSYVEPSQENVNRAWKRLGEKYGFDYMTAEPITGKGQRFFSAVPSEKETQREECLKKETGKNWLSEVKDIENQICTLEQRLKELKRTHSFVQQIKD